MKNSTSLRVAVATLFTSIIIVFVLAAGPKTLNADRGGGPRVSGVLLAADLAPALLVKLLPGDTTSVPLGISDLDIDIQVTGNIAVTTMRMSFYNDVNRNLEGEFVFPLAEGQSIHAFAMDVEGKMRDGVVVEKAKGQEIFESVERRRIDPGLLEWTKGNNFRARVFPIPAKGYKKFVISFQQELQADGNNFVYALPLAFRNKVKTFSIKAEVNGAAQQPTPTGDNAYMLTFIQPDKSWLAQAEYKNIIPDKTISFQIPFDAQKPVVYTEKIPGSTDSFYFYALVYPKVITTSNPAIHKAGIIWDVSGSASQRDRDKELSIIEAYLEKAGDAEVRTLVFSTAIHADKVFSIHNGNSQQLRTFLQSFEPDGGTQLGCLDLSGVDCNEILMFSDGQQTFGTGDIKFPKCPVHCISTGSSADFSMLQFISRSTGGQFINAHALDVQSALKPLQQSGFNFTSAQMLVGNITQVYPSMPVPCKGPFGVAGIMKGNNGTLNLNFGSPASASQGITVNLSDNTYAAKDIVGRLWAEKKIAELDLQFDKNKDEITALAKSFSIVTRNTSLLVLDRLEDYIQYHVSPPEPAMKKEYDERLHEQAQLASSAAKSHLEQVISDFSRIAEWWDKNFKAPEKPKSTGTRDTLPGNGTVGFESPGISAPGHMNYQAVVRNTAGEPLPAGKNVHVRFRIHDSTENGAVVFNQTSFAVTNQFGLITLTIGDSNNHRLDSINWNSGPKFLEVLIDKTGGSNFESIGTTQLASVPYAFYAADSYSLSTAAASYSVSREDRESQSLDEVQVVSTNANGCVSSFGYFKSAGNATYQWTPGMGSDNNSGNGAFTLKTWDPKEPYMDGLKKGNTNDLYKNYLALRKQYESTPSFFVDAADYFEKQNKHAEAVRILSNLAEMQNDNYQLMRVMAHRLQQWNENKPAIAAFENVMKERPEEPQSYRDLGLACAQNQEYQKAADMLCKVVTRTSDSRFPEIEAFAACEINHLMATSKAPLRLDSLDKRLLKNMPLDVRVVINWDADNCDMDLWVTDPLGEKCYYQNRLTKAGGRISRDFTQGYGPEEFNLKKAIPGTYKVQVNYYGDHQQRLAGPVTVQAEMYTNYGRPNEVKKEITLRLNTAKDIIDLGEFEFKE